MILVLKLLFMFVLTLLLVLFWCCGIASARLALVAVSLPPYVEEEDFPPAASKPSSDNRHSHSQETFSIFMELCKCRYHSLKRCINIKNTYVDSKHFPRKERNWAIAQLMDLLRLSCRLTATDRDAQGRALPRYCYCYQLAAPQVGKLCLCPLLPIMVVCDARLPPRELRQAVKAASLPLLNMMNGWAGWTLHILCHGPCLAWA